MTELHNTEPAEPALVICPHCYGGACEDCGWQGVLVNELIEADVIDDPLLGDPTELPEDATVTLGGIQTRGLESCEELMTTNTEPAWTPGLSS